MAKSKRTPLARESYMQSYVFVNSTSIKPYLERPHTGPTSHFCAELAARLRCHVIAGFQEQLLPEGLIRDKEERVGEYRKTNLFETDQSWSISTGTGFNSFALSASPRRMTLGICMDLIA
ncbi:hypothetical protein HDZ31DRAFT_75565 [Schizophyllum fasciatum]